MGQGSFVKEPKVHHVDSAQDLKVRAFVSLQEVKLHHIYWDGIQEFVAVLRMDEEY